MPRRPTAIVVITICYFLAPVLILLQSMMSNQLSFFGPGSVFRELPFSDSAVLLLYPVGAIAIYSVKKWGWYLFLGCSVLLIVYNVVSFILRLNQTLLFLIPFNGALAVFAGIFFRKYLLAPYFNPRLRWWETEPRYRVGMRAELMFNGGSYTGEITDISNSGCFILSDEEIDTSREYRVCLKCLKHSVVVSGKVVRKSALGETREGYGITFLELTSEQKQKISDLIHDLEKRGLRDYYRDHEIVPTVGSGTEHYPGVEKTASRYMLCHSAVLTNGRDIIHFYMHDISKSGCFVKSDRDMPEGAIYRVKLNCLKQKVYLEGRIERACTLDGERGYGIRFINLTEQAKRSIKALIRILRKLGAQERRTFSPSLGDEVLDESVAGSPYKIILFFKRLFEG